MRTAAIMFKSNYYKLNIYISFAGYKSSQKKPLGELCKSLLIVAITVARIAIYSS